MFVQNAQAEEKERLAASSTLYVGNLSFFTTESQIYEREYMVTSGSSRSFALLLSLRSCAHDASSIWPPIVFSQCASPEIGGGIKRIIMGLDRNQRSVLPSSSQLFSQTFSLKSTSPTASYSTPCGFAFVEYYLRSEALASMRYISGTKLDERVIRCDLDPGYLPGRELGRGKSGGQVSLGRD